MTVHDSNAAACAYYDGDCRFCIALARRFERVLARRSITLMPLQTVGAAARLGLSDDRLLTEMRLRLRNGHVLGGADAVMEIARRTLGREPRSWRDAADARGVPLDRASSKLHRRCL